MEARRKKRMQAGKFQIHLKMSKQYGSKKIILSANWLQTWSNGQKNGQVSNVKLNFRSLNFLMSNYEFSLRYLLDRGYGIAGMGGKSFKTNNRELVIRMTLVKNFWKDANIERLGQKKELSKIFSLKLISREVGLRMSRVENVQKIN